MQDFLTQEERKWAEDSFEKLSQKLEAECGRLKNKIPYIAEDGHYQIDWAEKDIAWWTNGFWGGILWQMYHATGKACYRNSAVHLEEQLDRALQDFTALNHDVGFMWMHTAVADYRLTGNHQSLVRGEHAASLLLGRFNPLANYICAWNENRPGWMIIDCLMNLSLLYWAGEQEKDPRFAAAACRHADTALEKLMRPDGSCSHIAILDPQTGELLETPGGQGYAAGSSWSRGQAWAVYGFAISYAHTEEIRYLDAAKRAAHYFLANAAATEYLPLCDFRAPEKPIYYDATAGACAACGLLEIAKHVSETEKRLYQTGALRLLRALDERCCDWNPAHDGIVGNGKVDYHGGTEQQSLIYGDYFYLEGILRLLQKDFFIW